MSFCALFINLRNPLQSKLYPSKFAPKLGYCQINFLVILARPNLKMAATHCEYRIPPAYLTSYKLNYPANTI